MVVFNHAAGPGLGFLDRPCEPLDGFQVIQNLIPDSGSQFPQPLLFLHPPS